MVSADAAPGGQIRVPLPGGRAMEAGLDGQTPGDQFLRGLEFRLACRIAVS